MSEDATPMRFIEPTHAPEDGRYPGFRPGKVVEDGLRIERDVEVPLRDGGLIYADVYLAAGSDEPAAPVIAWGPYGKHGGPARDKTFFPEAGIDPAWGVSRHAPTEAPDPVRWCPRGFAIVFPDPRGTWNTPGDFTMGTRQEARDFCDLVEWCGEQPWSNGKVGTTGASYLGFSQWRLAADPPGHLAAINPWEGLNDFYRELAYHGGIPERRFVDILATKAMGYSRTRIEDIRGLAAEHPLLDSYWEEKEAQLAGLEVPAYVVAGWSSVGLHLRGTLEAYKELDPARTWLEIHGRKIWSYYYDPVHVESQLQFFDWALRGVDNGWEDRPRVQLEVRERCNVGAVRSEREWPLARTEFRQLHLDAATGSLGAAVAKESAVSYETEVVDYGETQGRAVFDHVFEEDTELSGHMKLRLWIEIAEGEDADVFVAAQKLDADGEVVGFPFVAFREDGPVALGWLRASHRAVDPERSTPEQPWHLHSSEEPLQPGTPVALEIEVWPSSTHFAAGEALRLVVQGIDVYRTPKSEFGHDITRNQGSHTIHTGGGYDSHLLVPVIPGPAA